ncbi:MAG: Gfo/Idh/MocA family protein [Chthoniobacterales bacterium]
MLRGAIVGFGNVAQFGHWPAYQDNPDAKIVSVVDSSAERRAVAKQLSLQTCEAIDELRDLGIDFVDICTPPSHHAAQIGQCIRNGWHVLCEKPFVTTSAQLSEIPAPVGVAIVPVHNWKYAPIIRRATDLLRSGTIGNLQRAEIFVLRTQAAASSGHSWRGDPAMAGGGIVMDHGWHAIYLALNWFGTSPLDVKAKLVKRTADQIESEATLILGFASGSATISLSWNAASRDNRMNLIGDGGALAIEDDVLRVNGREEQFEEKLSAGSHHADWFSAMLPDVLAAFRDPPRAQPMFDEAVECLRIIEQTYASA